jgi:acyl-CoA hydrolase
MSWCAGSRPPNRVEVGLDGSVNAETLNGMAVGAVGGQLDFVRGANAAPGGRSIIALPATEPAAASWQRSKR